MYPQSCRILLLPFRKQLTCAVRPAAFVIHGRSYHASLPHILKRSENICRHSSSSLNSSLVFKQPNLSLLSRYLSTTPAISASATSGDASQLSPGTASNIPAPPSIPEVITDSATEAVVTGSLADPSLVELGLGSTWTPSGWIQNLLDVMHTGLDIPWWGCIALGVLAVRLCMFPLVIKAQINGAKMANNMPQMQVLQEKMSQARRSGNLMESAQYGFELQQFMKEKDVNPFKNLMVPLIQAPVFMSFFFALKGMANAPVPSMTHGGLFWFTDLTVCDPTYMLPILTSLTLLATVELGTDTARLNAQGSQVAVYILRSLPLIMFPITINFSAAILCYWLTTNLISLVQVGFLRIPVVRDYFNIPRLAPVVQMKSNSKGFVANVKEAWVNQKITAELQDRQRVIDDTFKRAGTGPVQKTYSYDPTRQKAPTAQAVIQRGFKQTKKPT